MKNNKYFLLLLVLVFFSACKNKNNPDPSGTAPNNPPPQVVGVKNDEPVLSPLVELSPVSEAVKNMSPMEAIKDLDRQIDSYKTGGQLTPAQEESNNKLKQDIIRGTFDLNQLCRLALDSHWNEIDDKQKLYFTDLMTRLLQRKAIFSKEQVKGDGKPYKVTYKKEEYLNPDKKTALVLSKISVPSEKVDLNINYKLIYGARGWNIFDVIVDDASLVDNYKFQFDTIIKKYGYQDLIARMEKKLKEME